MDLTIILPVRNRISWANEAVQSALNCSQFPIIIIDDQSDSPDAIYLSDDRVQIIKNSFKSSLTALWNQGTQESKTEFVLIINDKIRFVENDFKIIVENLNKNFALVSTYRFGCFGFSKYLLYKMGAFDEGFTWGEYEDTDTLNRLFSANLAIYFTEETKYIGGAAAWSSGPLAYKRLENEKYYKTKWLETPTELIQLKEEKNISDRGLFSNYRPRQFASWGESLIAVSGVKEHFAARKYKKEF